MSNSVFMGVRRLRSYLARKKYAMMWPLWREGEQALLPRLVDRGKCAIDIGANRGQYALELSQLATQCHSFECNPSMVAEMRRMYDGIENIFIHEIALSNSAGRSYLTVPMRGQAMADGEGHIGKRILPDANQKVQRIEVSTSTLDLLKFERVGFIKIDVEGHELAVIEGAMQTIGRERPVLLVECEERHNPGGIQALRGMLEPMDYHIYFYADNKLNSIDVFDVGQHQNAGALSLAKRRRDMYYFNNFICSPRPLSI